MLQKVYEYYAIPISNYDGDTIRFDIDLGFNIWLKNESCRLAGIDTYELKDKDPTKKALAYKAKKLVEDLVTKDERCLLRTYKDKKGKYGRWIVEVFCESLGSDYSINQKLLDEGLAIPIEY